MVFNLVKWDNLWRALWNTFSIFLFKLPSIHPHLLIIIIIQAEPASKALLPLISMLTFSILTTRKTSSILRKTFIEFRFVFDSLMSSKCVLVQGIDFNLRFYLRWTIIINFKSFRWTSLFINFYFAKRKLKEAEFCVRLSVHRSRTNSNIKSSTL